MKKGGTGTHLTLTSLSLSQKNCEYEQDWTDINLKQLNIVRIAFNPALSISAHPEVFLSSNNLKRSLLSATGVFGAGSFWLKCMQPHSLPETIRTHVNTHKLGPHSLARLAIHGISFLDPKWFLTDKILTWKDPCGPYMDLVCWWSVQNWPCRGQPCHV